MKRSLLAAVMLTFVFSCQDEERIVNGRGEPGFQNLTRREHVLNNVQLAYNSRRVDKYDELLDADFTFFLSAGDVGGGLPESWGRAEEVLYNTRLFDPNYSGYPRCNGIALDLAFEEGVDWDEVHRPGAPGETWYATAVYYDFKFDMEGSIFWISLPGSKAQFTVRNAGTDNQPFWKLVEMHDLDGSALSRARAGLSESKTWGAVKALYR